MFRFELYHNNADSAQCIFVRYTNITYENVFINLSVMDLRIKDTSVIQMPIDGPKWSAIETCTYLTSKIRTPLYSVLQKLDPVILHS